MIKIDKEPKDLHEIFRVYEKCVFCHKETDTWNLETNTPLCRECAKTHSMNDLDNDYVGFERSKNFSEESYLKAAGINPGKRFNALTITQDEETQKRKFK